MLPQKSLGQNFLKDQTVLDQIIKAADLSGADLVMEIGPGEGALTAELIKYAQKIICVEKDGVLAEKLGQNFKFSIYSFQSISQDAILNFQNKTAVIAGDILEINLPQLIEKNNFRNYRLIANIPYYITSPIIRLFLETKYPPAEMILMVQKEVAERIVAQPGQMSLLAVAVQYYAQAELLFYVDKKSFWPRPDVDSAVIRITPSKEHDTKENAQKFFQVVRAGFSAKRKLLVNNLTSSLHLEKKTAGEAIKKAGIDPAARAQELSVDNWKRLSSVILSQHEE